MVVLRKIIIWSLFAAAGGAGSAWMYLWTWRGVNEMDWMLTASIGATLGLVGGLNWTHYILRKTKSEMWRLLIAGFIGVLTGEIIALILLFLPYTYNSETPIGVPIFAPIPSFIAGLV